MRRSDGNGGVAPATGAPPGCRCVDVADVRDLLERLSQLRLALVADLSAAVGALEADRPDLAAQLIAGDEGMTSGLNAQPVRLSGR